MVVQMDNSERNVSVYIINNKYNKLLIKIILVGICICKVKIGNARTAGKSVRSSVKNQTDNVNSLDDVNLY